MKKLDVFLLITLALFCFSGTAYAKCQIQFDAEADRVMHLGGDTLRGNFATKQECIDYWKSRPAFERAHSKCVGCDEQNSSRRLQGRRRGVSQDNNIRQMKLREEAKQQQMIRQQKQKEQQARAEFEQDKKGMITQLKGGSGGEGLSLKGREGTLALKSGNVSTANQGAAKAIKDLRNSVYWSLEAANAASSGNYEPARESADFPNRPPRGKIQLPSVPDVPAPVRADPQVRLYKLLIKEVNQTTSELKLVNTNLKQVKEEKKKAEGKIDLQKTKIEELKQKKSEQQKEDKQEDMDGLIAAAQAALNEAEKQDREASKKIVSLNEQEKKQEENLSRLQQVFDTAEKHPEQAGKILKKLEGGK